MRPIYRPSGKAREYADWALNLYTGCPNGCAYCYAPAVLRKSREEFAVMAKPRTGIVEAARRQLAREDFGGELIHLCFTCDPYPTGMPTMITRDAIEAIHEAGAFVQVLTKNPTLAERDFDVLGAGDRFGVTYTGAGEEVEPNSDSGDVRLEVLKEAKRRGLSTWVSCEPVIDMTAVHELIIRGHYIDKFRVGKMSHAKTRDPFEWGRFGAICEELAENYGRNLTLKESLKEDVGRWSDWIATT